MPYKVLLTHDVVNDLEKLFTWISRNDFPEAAEHVLDKIEGVFKRLSELPERGTHPRELSVLGIREFREVFFKPYRIVYRVERSTEGMPPRKESCDPSIRLLWNAQIAQQTHYNSAPEPDIALASRPLDP